MKTINVVNGPQNVPAIIHDCTRMPALSVPDAVNVIRNTFDQGVTFFDHASCYGNGETEQRFDDSPANYPDIGRQFDLPVDSYRQRGYPPHDGLSIGEHRIARPGPVRVPVCRPDVRPRAGV